MATRNQKVQSYFHRSAADFDRLYNKNGYLSTIFNTLFRKALYKRTDETIKELKNSNCKSVLDVGCGTGVNAIQFIYNGCETVTGVDYAEGMIALAKQQTPQEVTSKINYIAADFMNWECNKKFDAVVALGVFDYLDEPRKFLDKMYGFAQKRVMFSVPGKGNLRQFVRKVRYNLRNCPLYFYSRNELSQLLEYPDCSFTLRGIGSSGFLCVIDKTK
ncbi:MAG: methyltransferase domain-containing protein [Candidatus Latescibacteria bacterium]|nr:methyltransferase domain-containing protein [Candidatus Latescibacterota bacterium]